MPDELYAILHVTVPGENYGPQRLRVTPGMDHSVPIRAYGITVPILISVDVYVISGAGPAEDLTDARHLRPVLVNLAPSYEYCRIPSKRPFWAVMQEAAQHGVINPTHGVDCICMDDIIREVKVHLQRAMPELQSQITIDPDTSESHIRTDPESEAIYRAAQERIHMIFARLG